MNFSSRHALIAQCGRPLQKTIGKILKDEQIMAALEKLGQDTKSLPRTIKQYEKPDKKLRQAIAQEAATDW